jgi:glycine/D-amino acid oxidase-like deaminating enzyme
LPALRRILPQLGDGVIGASWSPYDGQANPLRLLQALHRAYAQGGGLYAPDHPVSGIDTCGNGFAITTLHGSVRAHRIVLASGLGNTGLGAMLGRPVPVTPVRGQIMVTERVPPLFDVAIEQVRQLQNGSLLIGSTWEAGVQETGTTFGANALMARKALTLFPMLSKVRVLRSWAALRIISPDAAPIYDELVSGAFLVTCHSGVSLAAIHAGETACWIADGAIPEDKDAFSLKRFSSELLD